MRKLSGKTINSLALCVALAAPLVYMFGSLFMYLAGAHGNMELANDETELRILNKDNFTKGQDASTNNMNDLNTDARFACSQIYEVKEESYTFNIQGTINSAAQWRTYYYDSTGAYIVTKTKYGTAIGQSFVETTPSTAKYARFSYFGINDPNSSTYFVLQSATIEGYTRTLTDNSKYLFGQFFAQDNWLAVSGREVLEATPQYGFEPIGELVRYTDANMLHLANLSYGPLVIGYTYYCAHVIIVDLIFYIGSFIPRLIKKTINKLEGGLD